MNEARIEHSLSTAISWTIVLIVLTSLLGLCVHRSLHRIPEDISQRVHSALEQAGYGLGTVRVDGRDVILTGPVVATDAVRITDTVNSVRGVREVWTELTIVSSSLMEHTPVTSGSSRPVARTHDQ